MNYNSGFQATSRFHYWQLPVLIMLFCAGCGEAPVAGNMTRGQICQASEAVILQRLGENFSGNESDFGTENACTVQPVDERYVQVYSYYVDPEGTTYEYTARAVVNDEALRVYEIRVSEIDAFFLPFRFFPDREFY